MRTYEFKEFGQAVALDSFAPVVPGHIMAAIEQDFAFFTYRSPYWNDQWVNRDMEIARKIYGRPLIGWRARLPVLTEVDF